MMLPRGLAPLGERNFRLVWWAGLISLAGDWALRIALPIVVLELTGSVAATSGVVIAAMLPTLLFGPLAGVFVDRWDRRRVMVFASLAQALALLPLLAVDDPGAVWIVYAVAFAETTLKQFFGPAEAALLPMLVGEDQLVAANALNAVNNNVARLCGPAVGGLVAGWAGIIGVALLDVATFALSAVLLVAVRGRFRVQRVSPAASSPPVPPVPPVPPGATSAAGSAVALTTTATEASTTAAITDSATQRTRHPIRTLVGEFTDGLRVIRGSRVLMVLISTFALISVGEGIMGALLAVYVKDALRGGAPEVGWLMSAQAVGGILGGLAGGWFGERFSPVRLVSAGAIALGVIDLVLFTYPTLLPVLWPGLVLLVMAGVPGVLSSSSAMSLIQVAASREYSGRVFAVSGTAMGLCATSGATLAAALGDRLGATALLMVQAVGLILGGVAVGVLLRVRGSTESASRQGAARPVPRRR